MKIQNSILITTSKDCHCHLFMCWNFIKSNELQTKVCETDTNEKQFTSWLWIALVSNPKEQLLRPWLPLTTMRKLNGISKILITPDRCMQKIILKNDI